MKSIQKSFRLNELQQGDLERISSQLINNGNKVMLITVRKNRINCISPDSRHGRTLEQSGLPGVVGYFNGEIPFKVLMEAVISELQVQRGHHV